MPKFKLSYYDNDDFKGYEIVVAENIVEADKILKDHASKINANYYCSVIRQITAPDKEAS